jgi:3-oxoacyl-[acyl-carrier protein] reductase
MKIELENKVVFVTGGNRGIGKAITYRLSEIGATTVFTYNSDSESAFNLLNELRKFNKKVYCFQLDINNRNRVFEVVNEIENTIGNIFGLVNNAGITKDSSFFLMEDSAWKEVLDTNLTGTYYVTKAIVEKMILRGEGKIVNISSIAGFTSRNGQSNYCASKAGIIALTKVIAKEFAKYNIHANVIAPGLIETEMAETYLSKIKQVQKVIDEIPLGRLGLPEEIAYSVLFLLSNYSNYITGQTLVIDGGVTA